jgi:hypothetical protein
MIQTYAHMHKTGDPCYCLFYLKRGIMGCKHGSSGRVPVKPWIQTPVLPKKEKKQSNPSTTKLEGGHLISILCLSYSIHSGRHSKKCTQKSSAADCTVSNDCILFCDTYVLQIIQPGPVYEALSFVSSFVGFLFFFKKRWFASTTPQKYFYILKKYSRNF